MIPYHGTTLSNGLRVLVHEDDTTPLATVCVGYYVGSRDEHPNQTGFAHLFEHLMFSGSKRVPNYDHLVQNAGGDSNAFTNNDYTCYYLTLPANNLEAALFAEADRMAHLRINKRSLGVQRKVVVEEFKETCLNQPYGDIWHLLSELAYREHSYRWPVIGLQLAHIEQAQLEQVQEFYERYYCPANAVLVVAGAVKTNDVLRLAARWFEGIAPGQSATRLLPVEPPQHQWRVSEVYRRVPTDALMMYFHTPARYDRRFYAADLLSDVLSNGKSSRLYQRLVRQHRVFSEIDASVTATFDPGLLVIEGKPALGVSLDVAQEALLEQLELLSSQGIGEEELRKAQHKVESNLVFSEVSAQHKAQQLLQCELLDTADIANQELGLYAAVTPDEFNRLCKQVLLRSNGGVLQYRALS